jgi:ammonia channel protein AmtB
MVFTAGLYIFCFIFDSGICAMAHPWEGLVIGGLGAVFVVASCPLLDRLKIDDPVGVVPVHCVGAIWGMISIGLFTEEVRRKKAPLIYTES